MTRSILLACLAILLVAADDPWTKVRELKSGTELRIYKKAVTQPVVAKLDHATEESLVIVLKNEQSSVPKEEIDRLDYRPAGGSRMTKQTTSKTNTLGNPSPDQQRVGGSNPGPSSSQSTSITLGSKPAFETIYRRTPLVPKN
ncbi:MAG TPA: hypothetical protein VEX68_11005 [Bryobacteraceae bacterium]|nr:hypothetical protein [Bryobacteraceae bacterium]